MATTVMGMMVATAQADTTLSGLCPGGFWVGQEPEGADPGTGAFVVLTHEGEDLDPPTSENTIEVTRCTLHAFAEGAANCEAIVQAIKNAFDFLIPTLTGASDMGILRTRYVLSPSERASDVGLVFEGAVSFIVRVSKPRVR